MRDKRDRQKKRFIETLTAQGTVYHAAQAAGISRWTAYRWRQEDLEFADQWDEAIENAVDAVESVLYQKALSGDPGSTPYGTPNLIDLGKQNLLEPLLLLIVASSSETRGVSNRFNGKVDYRLNVEFIYPRLVQFHLSQRFLSQHA